MYFSSMCNEHSNKEERQNGRAERSVWNLAAKMARHMDPVDLNLQELEHFVI